MLYLDAAATAPLRPEAREAMLQVLDGGPGNASAVHTPVRPPRRPCSRLESRWLKRLGRHPGRWCLPPAVRKPIIWHSKVSRWLPRGGSILSPPPLNTPRSGKLVSSWRSSLGLKSPRRSEERRVGKGRRGGEGRESA